ncbi:MAG: hypothetical protein AAGF93_12245 [Cyanobacteria bacterium P01_H01_bin.105]
MSTQQLSRGTTLIQGQGASVVTPTNGRLTRYGGGSNPGATVPTNSSLSNIINQGLQSHRANFSNTGNRTSTAKGPRGLSSSAANINNFGSANANVARSAGTAITGSARTNAAIQAINQAKYGKGTPSPSGTLPTTRPTVRTAATGAALTTAGAGTSAGVSSALFTPVSANPAGMVLVLGAGVLGAGLYIGNKIYEGIGRPFGPSIGDHLKAAATRQSTKSGSSRRESPPPFEGGQMAGVRYKITSQGRTSVNGEVRIAPPTPNVAYGIGPISYYQPDTTENTAGTTLVDALGNIVANVRVSSGNPETKLTAEFVILDVVREDGQQDTGGNAAGESVSSPPYFPPNSFEWPAEPPQELTEDASQERLQELPSENQELLDRLKNLGEQQATDNSIPPLFIPGDSTRRPPGRTPPPANDQSNPSRKVTRTRRSSSCGCNKGILDGVSDLLGNNSVNIANSGLLATILGLLQQVGDVVGLGAFPITAPTNLNAKAAGTTTLNNLGEAHLWQAKNLDSTIGGWPNTIQDLDSGNPLENLTVSDSLAEIQGMLMAMAVGQGINQQGIFKTLTETTGIKQQSMLARQFSQANAEYLGYNLNQTTRTVPNTYTPGVENILELLNPGQIPMEAVENVDDMDLQSCLRELCASAAIIRAVFFRNTGTDDIEQALREKIDQARNVNDTAGSGDFREYLNQVEQGFGFPNPYGRDQTQGPRLSDRSDPTTP